MSVLIGAGIDGRGGMGAVFDGLTPEKDVTPLALESVQAFESGAVWLRYKIKKVSRKGDMDHGVRKQRSV